MNIALITGATSGIGREFYRLIIKNYPMLDEIWCVGRDADRLKTLPRRKRPALRTFQLDLASRSDIEKLEAPLKRQDHLFIWLLVNAAGTGRYGSVADTQPHELADTIRINCEALTLVTDLCLPYMRRKSRIIQMCSGAAFFPQPDFAVYAASKTYVLNFSLALSQELKVRGITVTAVCPGPVDTPFLKHARAGAAVPKYKSRGAANPFAVAEKALRDAARGRRLSIYGFSMNALYLLSRCLPQGCLIQMTDYLNHKGDTNEKN